MTIEERERERERERKREREKKREREDRCQVFYNLPNAVRLYRTRALRFEKVEFLSYTLGRGKTVIFPPSAKIGGRVITKDKTSVL